MGRRVQGNCSQTGCLKTMRKHLVTYLGSQSYRCSLFALLLNFICMIAFSVTVFLAQPSPFEASLLTLLYLGLLYIVCTLKVLTIDAEWKGIQRMLACIQLDLSRYNRHSVLILENDVKDGEL